MPFPATNGDSFPMTLDVAWSAARNTAAQIQTQCANLNAQISSGSVSAQTVINVLSTFVGLNAQLSTYSAVPGLSAYAQAQVNNPSLDVVAAFASMQSALIAVGAWIIGNFPIDSSGYLQALRFNGGTIQWATFSTAQLSGLAALLTALSATID